MLQFPIHLTCLLPALIVTLTPAMAALAASEISPPSLPQLSNVFSAKAFISNPPEGVTTLLETYVDGPHGRMLKNWSTPFGFSAQLVLGDLQLFYLLFKINGTLQCFGGTANLPHQFPAANWNGVGAFRGLMIAPNGRPAYHYDRTIGKYVSSFFVDATTGLPAATMSTEMDFTTTSVFGYVNGTVTDPSTLIPPAECAATPTPTPTQPTGKQDFVRTGDPHSFEVPPEYLHSLQDPASMLLHHFGALGAQHWGNPLVPSSTATSVMKLAEAYAEAEGAALQPEALGGNFALPDYVDNSLFATPVRNQGVACGACWAFSSVAAAEVAYRKAKWLNSTGNVSSWLSVQTLIDCAHHGGTSAPIASGGCQGGWPATALCFIANNGVPRESDYSFEGVTGDRCHFPDVVRSGAPIEWPISSFYVTPYLNTTAMMEAVWVHGAVVAIVNFFLTPPFGDVLYSGGVYNNPICTPGLSHAVTIVGYGTENGVDYWLVKNSMGQAWGVNGYFKMARGINMCGIEDFGFVPVA